MMLTRRAALVGTLSCLCCPPGLAQASAGDVEFRVLCGMRETPRIAHVDNLRDAAPEAERVVQWISGLIGMRPEFEILEADFEEENIALAATRGDRRYVVYDAKWFTFDDNEVGWYAVWVLAHEIGHHIYGNTLGFAPDPQGAELDADRFGGWVVARLGGNLEQALSFMPYLSKNGSDTHPARKRRAAAARDGWLAGSVRP